MVACLITDFRANLTLPVAFKRLTEFYRIDVIRRCVRCRVEWRQDHVTVGFDTCRIFHFDCSQYIRICRIEPGIDVIAGVNFHGQYIFLFTVGTGVDTCGKCNGIVLIGCEIVIVRRNRGCGLRRSSFGGENGDWGQARCATRQESRNA